MEQGKTKIIKTDDGSHSLFVPSLNETYHSFHGAIQESKHVFIKNGLKQQLQNGDGQEICLLEVGFGTGLNTLLAYNYAEEKNAQLVYHTLEPFPLAYGVIAELNYGQLLEQQDTFLSIHETDWGVKTKMSNSFTLIKHLATIEGFPESEYQFDLVFFDAFAPSKQPGMWTLDILKKVVIMMKPGAAFVTYCATGQLKRDLKYLGLKVETLAGPPGKKEMVRAIKPL